MVLLAVVSLEIPLALDLRDRVDAEVRSTAENQADVVAALAVDYLGPAQRAKLRELARTAAQRVRGRVIVVDARGRLLVDSAGAGIVGDSWANRPEIAAALRGHRRQERRRSNTLREDLLATAVPLVRRGRTVGAVRVTQSVAAVQRAVWRTVAGLALLGAVVLGLALVAGALIAGDIARPLRRLEAAARRVAGGDLSARAEVEGSAEQRSLARSFNEMTHRLGRLLTAQRTFVADASHGLRTPLTGLRLRLEEARAARTREEADRELDLATAELDRLATLVDDLLVLTRAGERERPGEACALDACVERVLERWTPIFEQRGLTLTGEARPGAGAVWADPADVDRALDALVENALRYSPPGGEVVVSTAPGRVEIRDHGPGLAPGEEEAVFERFHRGAAGRSGTAGTGLGLPIARELTREWGGDTTVSNAAGGGAVAGIALPATREPVVEAPR